MTWEWNKKHNFYCSISLASSSLYIFFLFIFLLLVASLASSSTSWFFDFVIMLRSPHSLLCVAAFFRLLQQQQQYQSVLASLPPLHVCVSELKFSRVGFQTRLLVDSSLLRQHFPNSNVFLLNFFFVLVLHYISTPPSSLSLLLPFPSHSMLWIISSSSGVSGSLSFDEHRALHFFGMDRRLCSGYAMLCESVLCHINLDFIYSPLLARLRMNIAWKLRDSSEWDRFLLGIIQHNISPTEKSENEEKKKVLILWKW